MLIADSLTMWEHGRRVVDDIALRVNAGEVVGLLGRNGAGKTTILRMLSGLAEVGVGRIEFQGQDITGLSVQERSRRGLRLVPTEDTVLRGQTVRECLLAVAPGRPVDALLRDYGLAEAADRKAGTLKPGERRRLQISRAMADPPSLLLLDEPFMGPDPIEVGELQALIRRLPERGTAVLFSDHNVRESLDLCDRAYVLHEGRVIKEGTPPEFLGRT